MTDPSPDLMDFLRMQLEADEQTAQAASWAVGRDWDFKPMGRYDDEWALHDDSGSVIFIADRCPPIVGVHIALHDPVSVRADVAAKRAVVELHRRFLTGSSRAISQVAHVGASALDGAPSTDEGWPCATLRLLAQAYRWRDGWREEWQT